MKSAELEAKRSELELKRGKGPEVEDEAKHKELLEGLKKNLGVEGEDIELGKISIYDFVKFVHQLSDFNSKISGDINPVDKSV